MTPRSRKLKTYPIRALKLPASKPDDWLEDAHPLVKAALMVVVCVVIGMALGSAY
jgi:hypothetical protein